MKKIIIIPFLIFLFLYPGGTHGEVTVEEETRFMRVIEEKINRNRKSDKTLIVRTSDGMPAANTEVKITQLDSYFLFGNLASDIQCREEVTAAEKQIFEERYLELYNSTTVTIHEACKENINIELFFICRDQYIQWAMDNGLRMKIHPLLWVGVDKDEPAPYDDLMTPQEMQERVRVIVERYKDKVDRWEILNEAYHHPEIQIDDAFMWARAYGGKHLIVNEYGYTIDLDNLYNFMKDAVDRGVDFDGIGIQTHYLSYAVSFQHTYEIIDRMAELGKPLHITEFDIHSNGFEIWGDTWRTGGTWTEEAQAEYAEKFYTVAFSHPAVVEITWWGLWDKYSWKEKSTLLREDLSPKPVYYALKNLIKNKWRTVFNSKTDENGVVTFNGFHGFYKWEAGGNEGFFEVEKQPGLYSPMGLSIQ